MTIEDHAQSGWARTARAVLPPVLLLVAGLVAYWNCFDGVFMFDDRLHILGDRRLKALWPLTEALSRKRPVVDYSLAVQYAIHRDNPWGYHLVNVCIHLAAGLALFGVVRRTLLTPRLRDRFSGPAPWLALAVALLWIVHPLNTQAVTYLIQRAESLMGMFYLLTLYGVIRGTQSRRAWPWYVLSFGACTLGMASKGVMITAPVVVLAYDRIFLAPSFGEMIRRRWLLYVGLFATWGVLWHNRLIQGVFNVKRGGGNVGFGRTSASPFEYLLTQFEVIPYYLRLAIWPDPLCLDYRWPFARSVAEVLPGLAAVAALAAGTIWALFRKPWLGFAGLWFFVILSPTSSIVPIKDPVFEHRMYLPLAGLSAVAVGVGYYLLSRLRERAPGSGRAWGGLAAVALVLSAGSLTWGTIQRNRVYHSESAMWRNVLATQPENARAAENLGMALMAEGKLEAALSALEKAVKVTPGSANVRNGLGFVLVAYGRMEEAIEQFRKAIELRPTFARAYVNLGNALAETGRPQEAFEQFQRAVEINPTYTDARLNFGNALLEQGRIEEAIDQYRIIVSFDPAHAKGWGNLGVALMHLAQRRAMQERTAPDPALVDAALQALDKALSIEPTPAAYNSRGITLATIGEFDKAIEAFRQALLMNPSFSSAHYNMAHCLIDKSDRIGAIRHYRAALAGQPDNPNLHFELGLALLEEGAIEPAIERFEAALQLQPDHAGAAKALEQARERVPAASTG